MALSEEELRTLEQMERALIEEDPKLASTLRGTSFNRAARRRAILAGVVFVAGLALLIAGVLLTQPILGVIAFLVMLGAAAVSVTALRNPRPHIDPMHPSAGSRNTKAHGFSVVDGGKRPKPRKQRSGGSLSERMEERWRRRREGGGF